MLQDESYNLVVLDELTYMIAYKYLDENRVLEAVGGVVSRGIVLCHVEIGVEEVAGKKPTGVQRGGRWSVLGFSVGSGAE